MTARGKEAPKLRWRKSGDRYLAKFGYRDTGLAVIEPSGLGRGAYQYSLFLDGEHLTTSKHYAGLDTAKAFAEFAVGTRNDRPTAGSARVRVKAHTRRAPR